jgi:threonine/homoserine/homoserine lactone efflux protein
MALCWLGVAVELVSQARGRLLSSGFLKHMERLAATVLIALGLHLALY